MANDDNDERRGPVPLPGMDARERDLVRGLIHLHDRITSAGEGQQELAAHLYALTELLIARGLIGLGELEQRKQMTRGQLPPKFLEATTGTRLLADKTDKRTSPATTLVDRASRLPLCKAACCRLEVWLSSQDVLEGVLRWDLTTPYRLARAESGLCIHCDPGSFECRVRDERPLTCRHYSCEHDDRIWADFHKMILAPGLEP